ncbi:MAG: RHS repeat-associated core domain-containing protein [Planctomycetia bacterium]|nr:RHS repeat-associated core domain-containing protein [Planctomycetia bacterium]
MATTWYVYEGTDPAQNKDEGNPVRIVTEAAADPGVFSATHFVYDKAQRVWLMMGEAWEADGPDEGDCVDGYAITWAREFRYDAARARYLNRELDPEALEEGDLVALSEVWTDYDGDSSYGDWEFNANDPPTPDNLRSYEPGVALKDPWDESSGIASSGIESSGIEYYHADLIGTTRAMTDYTGASASTVCYTAFGERLDSDDYLRYGYAGSWGYQAHDVPNGDPVQFLHVGWRYYDPGTGRFLQRDPIGIKGGANVFSYANNSPIFQVDPSGLIPPGGGPLPFPLAELPTSGIPAPSSFGGPTGKQAMKGAGVVLVGCACAAAPGAGVGVKGAGTVGTGMWGYDEAVDFFTWLFYWPCARYALEASQ